MSLGFLSRLRISDYRVLGKEHGFDSKITVSLLFPEDCAVDSRLVLQRYPSPNFGRLTNSDSSFAWFS
jgi:hypothetical protein